VVAEASISGAGRLPIGVVVPYWTFWESSVDYDLRADREQFAATAIAALAADVLAVEIVADADNAARAAQRIEGAGAEAILVLQTMAVPPATTIPALGDLPVVVWAVHRRERVPDDLDHGGITSEGATVGTPMVASALARTGRAFEVVVGRIDDAAVQAAVDGALRAAVGARRISRGRIGKIGSPLPGYDFVDADAELLWETTGAELVPIPPAEVRELYAAVEPERVRELESETREIYDVQVEGESLQRSLRAACALDDLVARHRLDAGAMNCHVPEIRFGDEIGITPCFALGRSASNGVPWSCTGDVLTAFALLTAKLLGGVAQYHELQAVDYTTDEFVIASSGEFDLALAGGERAKLIPNSWFAHDPRCGACACFSAPEGPATLVGFAQLPTGFRLVAAEGEFTGRSWPGVGTANAAFRFARGRGPEAWEQWCRSGVGHHSAASRGHLGSAVATLARFLGLEAVVV
jgi:L-arabinose isomerase